MPDLLQKSLSFHVAVLVGAYWVIVFAVPFMIADPDVKPGVLGWCFFAGWIGYCVYTGLRAFRRGWKARFILRIVIPAALFVMAWIIVAASSWP